jgi:hypothetical protein
MIDPLRTERDAVATAATATTATAATAATAATTTDHDDLVARLTPQHDLLLVRSDPQSRQLGSGLVAPDNSAELHPHRTGVVLKAGPSALYAVGDRIVFWQMTTLANEGPLTGDDGALVRCSIGILPSGSVLATFAAAEEALPVPLVVEGVAHTRPPYGCMLVERATIPDMRGGIHYPGTYVAAIRSMEARIHSKHPACDAPYSPGDLVLLVAGIGQSITFGLTGERVLSVVAPSQVLCAVSEPLDRDVEPSSDIREYVVGAPRAVPPSDDPRWDEGDRRAPQ